MYEYELNISSPGGNCVVPSGGDVVVSVTVQNDTSNDSLIDYYFFNVKNSSNQIVKRFRYFRNGTTEFVLKPNQIYDFRTDVFQLPAGTYRVDTTYFQSDFVPGGKYYAQDGIVLMEF